jgi:hypothetical protein
MVIQDLRTGSGAPKPQLQPKYRWKFGQQCIHATTAQLTVHYPSLECAQGELVESWAGRLLQVCTMMMDESTCPPVRLEVLTAVVDFPLSLQLQLFPSPGAGAPGKGGCGREGASRAASEAGSHCQGLIGANNHVLQSLMLGCVTQLSDLVERWEGGKGPLEEVFLRQGLLLRWLRGLHLLELEAAGLVLAMAGNILNPDTHTSHAGQEPGSPAFPGADATLADQVRGDVNCQLYLLNSPDLWRVSPSFSTWQQSPPGVVPYFRDRMRHLLLYARLLSPTC